LYTYDIPPTTSVKHSATTQVVPGTHVEAALQRHIRLSALGLAKLKIIIHGFLEGCLDAFGVLAFIGYQVTDKLKPTMQHLILIAVFNRS
jgi:hypothetical protein